MMKEIIKIIIKNNEYNYLYIWTTRKSSSKSIGQIIFPGKFQSFQ